MLLYILFDQLFDLMGVPWCPLQPTKPSSMQKLLIPKWYIRVFIPWFSGLLRHMESDGGWGTMVLALRSPNEGFVTTRCLATWTKVNSTTRSFSVVNPRKCKRWRKPFPRQVERPHGVALQNWKTPSANLICFLSSLDILDSMHG